MQKADIIKILRENGFRITKQRELIIDVIAAYPCHSCKEIYYEASKRDPAIGIATVYRMLNTLEEVGAISRRRVLQFSCALEEPKMK